MDSTPAPLNQPWKGWFKAASSLDVVPLQKPISLGRARQGSLPQQPRTVDLSTLKRTLEAPSAMELPSALNVATTGAGNDE